MWILRAVAPAGGKLTAIERNPARARLASKYISEAGYGDNFQIHDGEWFTALESMHGPYDLIFLDILRHFSDDRDAIHALELCIPRLRAGGLLIVDNVLCNALVLEDEDVGPIVRGIQEFNRAIMNHSELESVIVPLRDGVAICRKRDA
jgi:predicted O-methyltransferase YrrM